MPAPRNRQTYRGLFDAGMALVRNDSSSFMAGMAGLQDYGIGFGQSD
jgi:hypothetical protein